MKLALIAALFILALIVSACLPPIIPIGPPPEQRNEIIIEQMPNNDTSNQNPDDGVNDIFDDTDTNPPVMPS